MTEKTPNLEEKQAIVCLKQGGLYDIFSYVNIRQSDPCATTEVAFYASSNPQSGQEWMLNQNIQLAGHTLKLVSITANSHSG